MEALVVNAEEEDAQSERRELADQGRVVEPALFLALAHPPQHDQGRVFKEANLANRKLIGRQVNHPENRARRLSFTV